MGVGVSIGAAAVVCCVHDRVKREVVTEAQVAELGKTVGQIYNPAQHKLHRCGCCDNLFVDPADTPRFCHRCCGPLRHQLGGPLPDPLGVVG